MVSATRLIAFSPEAFMRAQVMRPGYALGARRPYALDENRA